VLRAAHSAPTQFIAELERSAKIMETLNQISGWLCLGLLLWAVISTLIKIHKEIGLLSNAGFMWGLAVVIGNLFGVFLFRFLRNPCENLFRRLFNNI
jgi:hypothetical protein